MTFLKAGGNISERGSNRTWPRSRPERVESRMGRRKWKEKSLRQWWTSQKVLGLPVRATLSRRLTRCQVLPIPSNLYFLVTLCFKMRNLELRVGYSADVWGRRVSFNHRDLPTPLSRSLAAQIVVLRTAASETLLEM